MTIPVNGDRLCTACGHVSMAATGEWRVAPEKTATGLSVIGYQWKYQCADSDCAAVAWISRGRQRPA